MKRRWTKIMALFLAMAFIVLDVPTVVLAAENDVTELQISVIYDSEQVDITKDYTQGCVRLYDKPDQKTVLSYGSVWLTLTQYQVDANGKVDWNKSTTPEKMPDGTVKRNPKRLVSADLYEKDLATGTVTKIATFDETSGTLGTQQLPNSNDQGINIAERHGCKIFLRPPLSGNPRTYYFEGKTADGRQIRTGEVTISVKPLAKPVLIPPTIGRTDGFTMTTSDIPSSIQVFATKNIIIENQDFNEEALAGIEIPGMSITKGQLIIDAIRNNKTRLDAKRAALKAKLNTLNSTQLKKYARAIDMRSMDPEWEITIYPTLTIDKLVEMRVEREDIEFDTSTGKVIVKFDRNYVQEVNEILATGKNKPSYSKAIEAQVDYIRHLGDIDSLKGDIINSASKDIVIIVATSQRADREEGGEDVALHGATYNKLLGDQLYNTLYTSPNTLIDYDKNRDKFFLQVKLNMVALYTGEEDEKTKNYENKNIRAFIFTNQSGQQAGNWFSDAPSPDIRAMEIPEWSVLLTQLRKSGTFSVGQKSQDLYTYKDLVGIDLTQVPMGNLDNKTMIAAWNKCNFVGADAQVDIYGAESKSFVVDGEEPAYNYTTYFGDDNKPINRFLSGTAILMPAGKVGDQLGYRIVYEKELLDRFNQKYSVKNPTPQNQLNALNALIAMDVDAFEYYTGERLTQQALNEWLYNQVSGADMMARGFMVDSFQDFTESSSSVPVGTAKYIFGLSGGDLNYMIPNGEGCLSYILSFPEDSQIVKTSENEYSEITTTIDFRNAENVSTPGGKTYDSAYVPGSGRLNTQPKTKIGDTSKFKFKVEVKDGNNWRYHSDLSSHVNNPNYVWWSDGVLHIKFDQNAGVFFEGGKEYRICVMFPVIIGNDITLEDYRKGTTIDRHLPYEGISDSFRYRIMTVNTRLRCKKRDQFDPATGKMYQYPDEDRNESKELGLEYKDFIEIR